MGGDTVDLVEATIRFPSGDIAYPFPGIQLKPSTGYWISGPNGAGKSTLLNYLHDQVSGRYRTLKIDQAYDVLIYPYHSIWWNVAVPRLISGVPKSEAKAVAIDALQELGITVDVDRFTRNASGGEQRLITLARAYLAEPKLLFLDEPVANLDREKVGIVWNMFHRLFEKGSTVVFVSHEPPLAGPLVDLVSFPGVRAAPILIKELTP